MKGRQRSAGRRAGGAGSSGVEHLEQRLKLERFGEVLAHAQLAQPRHLGRGGVRAEDDDGNLPRVILGAAGGGRSPRRKDRAGAGRAGSGPGDRTRQGESRRPSVAADQPQVRAHVEQALDQREVVMILVVDAQDRCAWQAGPPRARPATFGWRRQRQPPAASPRCAAGRSTKNVLPRPGIDLTPTVPPIASTRLRVMVRPMPVPAMPRFGALSRWNGVNSRCGLVRFQARPRVRDAEPHGPAVRQLASQA